MAILNLLLRLSPRLICECKKPHEILIFTYARRKFTHSTDPSATSSSRTHCLRNEQILRENARCILNHMSKTSIVLHGNPGIGTMADELLRHGGNQHILAEPRDIYRHGLQLLRTSYKDRVLGVTGDDLTTIFLRPWKTFACYQFLEDHVTRIPWKQDPPITVILSVHLKPNCQLTNHLIHSLEKMDPLFKFGRIEFFLYVTVMEYLKMSSIFPKPDLRFYKPGSVMYYLLWDVTRLAKINKTEFDIRGKANQTKKKMKGSRGDADDYIYLIRAVPKPSWEHIAVSPEDLPRLYAFLTQILSSRKARLIPHLENYIPGCGPHLIMRGYTMLTIVGDVSPPELAAIFNEMQTWSEYVDSPLHSYITEKTNNYTFDDPE